MLDEKSGDWQKFLWVEFLNIPQLTQMQYSDCTNHTGHLLSEYLVQGTSFEGGFFNAVMPFSWILYKHIDEVVKATAEEPGMINVYLIYVQ